MKNRTLLRAATGIAVGAALALAVPLAASAHVHIVPNNGIAGSSTQLTFHVPTESATASTVGLEIDLPTDTPFTSVSYENIPGWTARIVDGALPKPVVIDGDTVTKAPAKLIWTADSTADGIKPGAFQLFTAFLGPLPDADSVLLPTIQTYSDGTVVRWDEPTVAGQEDPARPAPMLYVNEKAPYDPDSGNPPEASTVTAVDPTAQSALWIGFAGLVVGLGGVVVAVLALVRRPKDAQ